MPAFVIKHHRSCTVTLSERRFGFPFQSPHRCANQNDQIKKTKSHVALLCLPEGVGSNETKGDLFTMSKYPAMDRLRDQNTAKLALLRTSRRKVGGARRDRTDDILLAKQALSQLSYGPIICFDRP